MKADYRIADLTQEQMAAIEQLENQLKVTLVAWKPSQQAAAATRPSAVQPGHLRR